IVLEAVVEKIPDGASLLVGGFLDSGTFRHATRGCAKKTQVAKAVLPPPSAHPPPFLQISDFSITPETSHLPPGHRIETLLRRRLLLPVRIGDPAVRGTAIILAPPAYFAVRAPICRTRTRFCRTFALWVGHPFLACGRRRDLPLALVKIKSRIQFSL